MEQNRENGNLFKYLIPGEYAGNSAGFRKMILAVLPRIRELIEKFETAGPVLPEDLKADFRMIYSRYVDFLETRGLFEPGWMKPDISRLKDVYYVFFPEVVEDYTAFSVELEKSEKVIPVHAGKSETEPLYRFSSAAFELKWLLGRVSALLENGTVPEDIAITLADMKEWRKRLEEEASLRSIPVVIREGKPIIEYPGVSFFRDMGECSSNKYSIQSIKQLLLNSAIPWKDKDLARELVRFGVENSCIVNFRKDGRERDLWIERLKAAGPKELSDYYVSLKRSIESVTGSVSFEDLQRKLQRFISLFLDTGEWEGLPEIKEFQFALNSLNEAAAAHSKCGDLRITSPFSIWLTILEEKYMYRRRKTGVPVYPYRVSGGLDPQWHFIPGFSERVSSVVKDKFPFKG